MWSIAGGCGPGTYQTKPNQTKPTSPPYPPAPSPHPYLGANSALRASQVGALRLMVALRALQMFMGARVNDMSALFFGRRLSAPFPNIVTSHLQHANNVYN